MPRCSKSRTEGKELSREQSAELVPHPYYPAKYIHIQLHPHANTSMYKYICIGIHPYFPAKHIHIQLNPHANTIMYKYICKGKHPIIRQNTFTYNYIHMQMRLCTNTSVQESIPIIRPNTSKYNYRVPQKKLPLVKIGCGKYYC